jgi:branched-chain amino acid transport system substrate-binding protein
MTVSFTARRRALMAALTVTASLTVAACGGSESNSSASAAGDDSDPIVIGMSLPLTGPVADRAKPGYEGYKYWVDELNDNGGMLGRQVELKVLDDGFDQKTAISDYTKLIGQDKVDLVLGTFSSDLNLAVAPIAERYGYTYVQPSGGADEIFERGFKHLFFAQPATTKKLPEQFVKMISEAPSEQRPQTVAFVTVEDPNTTQLEEILREDLEALGLETVHQATYAADASNFDAIANAVKQADPDLVVNGSVAQDGIQFIRSLQKIGFSPDMLYQTNTPTDPAFADGIGRRSTEGILTYLGYSAEAKTPGNAEFVAGYDKKFGAPPSEDAANSYTAGQVLAAGVEGAGSLEQDAISEWLHANAVETISGPLSWDESGASQGDMLLAQFQDGQLRVIGPDEAATTDEITYKKPAW